MESPERDEASPAWPPPAPWPTPPAPTQTWPSQPAPAQTWPSPPASGQPSDLFPGYPIPAQRVPPLSGPSQSVPPLSGPSQSVPPEPGPSQPEPGRWPAQPAAPYAWPVTAGTGHPGPAAPAYDPWFTGPGYPPHFNPPAGPARRQRSMVPVVIAVIVALLLCAGAAIYTIRAISQAGGGVAGADAPGALYPTLNALLMKQSAALLRGDEIGFMAGVDPEATSTVKNYRRLYQNLRAMRVTIWQQSSATGDLPISGHNTFTVDVTYCLLVSECGGGMHAELHVAALTRDGRVLLEKLSTPAPDRFTSEPRPWEVSSLHVVVGKRVIVAASSAWAPQLARVLPMAEQAVTTADTYAHWGRPSVYIVYLASPSEGKRWFDGDLENVDGVAYTIDPDDIEAVAMMPTATDPRYAGPGALDTVLRHEFGHVATLHGLNATPKRDSFVEGIAEYCAYAGHPDWASYRIADVRDYLRTGKWTGSTYETSEITSSKVLTASAAYGIGYLALRRFVARYGLTRTLQFWGAVERDGDSLNTAAQKSFGTSWDKVNADAAAFIRRTVGA